ncbi:MAG: hypothetical protein ACPHDO_01640 [Candidatus Poseidoniaceae archaeon]
MPERVTLNIAQAREVEEQLFSTLRQQATRSVPVPLPRRDFWEKVGQLLDTIELEIHELYKTIGPSLKLQTLQRRQANIRRTASDLARKRVVALMQHSATMSLRGEGGGNGQDLPNLDWTRHDPAEREFYTNATEQLNKFKMNVNWNSMQLGLASEEMKSMTLAAGTTQLDSFVADSGGLTGDGPPVIALEDKSEPLPDIEYDEEDSLADAEAYPELEGLHPIEEEQNTISTVSTVAKHAAADELVPSKKKQEMDFDAWAEAETSDTSVKEKEGVEQELVRIRVIESLDEPIITADGEITLGIGDILFLESATANYLIDSGVAEAANL